MVISILQSSSIGFAGHKQARSIAALVVPPWQTARLLAALEEGVLPAGPAGDADGSHECSLLLPFRVLQVAAEAVSPLPHQTEKTPLDQRLQPLLLSPLALARRNCNLDSYLKAYEYEHYPCRASEREEEDRQLRPKLYMKRRTHVWKRQFSYQ